MNDKPAVTADDGLFKAIDEYLYASLSSGGPRYWQARDSLRAAVARAKEAPSHSALDRAPASSVDFHQRRGAAIDIIDEALESYRQFMLDDDFDYQRVLFSIMERMQARRVQYEAPVIAEHCEVK